MSDYFPYDFAKTIKYLKFFNLPCTKRNSAI